MALLSQQSTGRDETVKINQRSGTYAETTLGEIVKLCSSKDDYVGTGAAAFRYLCENLDSKYSNYDPHDFEHVAFIPAENDHSNRLAKPGDVFLDKKWKALGFFVVPDDYVEMPVNKLGVLDDPPTSKLLSHLTKAKPPDETAAREWFEILSGHVSGFDSHELVNLSKLPIVPTKQIRDWSTPAQCFLEGPRNPFYSKLFVFVDFGPAANRFLTACGARNEPTVADVSQSLVDDPARFYDAADGPENFLTQLRNLAVNKHHIPKMTLEKMKFGPVLLSKKNMGAIQAWNHYNHERQSPKKIVIVDDINAYRLFREDILVAPQEELLEEFYVSLGCKRLSDVVQERCKVVGNVTDHETVKRCLEIRILVLQRLAIFLHEFTYAKPKVSSDWLSKAGNFVVKACDSLSIYKTLEIGDQKIEKPQKTSAGAKKDNQGHIELWLSCDALKEPDMYEISTSLCRLLFGTAKVSESLLFSMILSADLEALGRRGCNVDLILKRCHIEQDWPDETKGDVDEQAPSSPQLDHSSQENEDQITGPAPRTPIPNHDTEAETFTASPSPMQSPVARASSSSVYLSEDSETLSTRAIYDGSHTGRSRDLLRRIFDRKYPVPVPGTAGTPLERPVRIATPQDEIRDKIDKAIKACNPGEVQLRRDFNDAEAGNKSSNDHYCHDVFAKTAKLKHVGQVRVAASGDSVTVQVFATEDFPRHKKFMTIKEEPLKHFAEIVVPIAEAYDLPTTSLNIFYDEKGSSIAFNRNGGLFLNLRYFEVWHDEDVANGDKLQAQTSWFFTLAHEIAHNMIKSHNSDHAYWFSKICEEHIYRILGPLVTGPLSEELTIARREFADLQQRYERQSTELQKRCDALSMERDDVRNELQANQSLGDELTAARRDFAELQQRYEMESTELQKRCNDLSRERDDVRKELQANQSLGEELHETQPTELSFLCERLLDKPSFSQRIEQEEFEVQFGVVCSLPVNRDDEEHIRRKEKWEVDPTGALYVPGYFESKVRMGANSHEDKQFRDAFSLIESDPANFSAQEVSILCYRGNLSDPKWVDEDEPSFSVLCNIDIDLSEAVKDLVMKNDSGRVYYRLDYDVIVSFRRTDVHADVCWISATGERRMSAKIIWN